MNIEKLKYFIDLVNNGSFTKTAKLNYVSQTTISQQIASLEKMYEVTLIDRDQKPVVPTEAGKLFYNEAKQVYERFELMEERMLALKEEKIKIKIAYTSIVDIDILAQLINELRDQSDLSIDVKKIHLSQLAEALENGSIDLAISVDSEFANHPKIEWIELYSGYYSAVVNKNHPLYSYKKISKEQLYSFPIVMLSKEILGQSYEMMIENSKAEGFVPNIACTASDTDEEIFLIQTENYIGFFPETFPISEKQSNLKMLPLENTTHKYKIVLAYIGDRRSFHAKKVLDFVNDFMHK